MKKLLDYSILFLGFILYLNYRLIFAFFIHKPVKDFDQFAKSKSNEDVWIIFFNDIFLITWYIFGFWYMLLFAACVLALNYTVHFVYLGIKKLRK